MSLETAVPGSPRSLREAARWLQQALHPAVERAAGVLREERRTPGWDGAAADAFGAWAGESARTTDRVDAEVRSAAEDLRGLADALDRAQDAMREVREGAREAGLEVTGTVVVDPGPGPADPGRLPAAPPGLKLTPAVVERHATLVEAWDTHQDRLRAYRAAVREADDVRRALGVAEDALQRGYANLRSHGWVTHGLGILGGALELRDATSPAGPVVVSHRA